MESLEKRRRQVETGGEQQRRLVWRHSGKDGRQSCREQRLRCWGRKRKSKEEVHGSRHSGCEGRYRVKGTAELWIWDAILVPVSLHFYCSKCCSSFFFFWWLTNSVDTFSMGCVFLGEATDQPPPRECWLYIWNQETHSNVYTCLLELSVGMECVHIYHLAIQVCKLKPLWGETERNVYSV